MLYQEYMPEQAITSSHRLHILCTKRLTEALTEHFQLCLGLISQILELFLWQWPIRQHAFISSIILSRGEQCCGSTTNFLGLLNCSHGLRRCRAAYKQRYSDCIYSHITTIFGANARHKREQLVASRAAMRRFDGVCYV